MYVGLMLLASCQYKAANTSDGADSVNVEDVASTESGVDNYEYLNSFFPVAPDDLLEFDGNRCQGGKIENGTAIRDVSLGKKLGEAVFMISTSRASLEFRGKVYELVNDPMMFVCSMKALDVDGDGEKEILLHSGDSFDLYIYQIREGKPELCGTLNSNYGFWVTDDYTMVSRIGSQGEATTGKLVNGKLETEERWLDHLMLCSKDLKNLRYDFDFTSDESLSPTLEAKSYALGKQEMTVLRKDLDHDGKEEQVVYYYSNWGMDPADQLCIIKNNSYIDLFESILSSDDVTGIVNEDDTYKIDAQIQLSAIDLDKDCVDEVIVTIGDEKSNSNYIFKLRGSAEVVLVNHLHYEGKRPVI